MRDSAHRAPPFQGSLKGQIRVVGLMVFASVVLATIVAVALIRESSSVQIASVSQALEGEIDEIVGRYERLQATSIRKNLAITLGEKDEAVLRALMTEALSDDPGMAGGFYESREGRVLGFTFPTARGVVPTEPDPVVREAAERVSRLAIAHRSKERISVDSGADVMVFRAQPVLNGETVEGAIWVTQPVAGIHALQGTLYRLAFLILLGLSIATTALAWRSTHHLDRAIRTIEGALSAKESQPDRPVPKTRVEEIDRIGAGIDHLARTLDDHRKQQRDLEDRLHRADRLAILGKLVAGVAHEIRNPLASIKLKLHLVRRDRAGMSGSDAAFSVIEEEIGRLDRMVARLLTISKAAKANAHALQDLAQIVEARADFWSGRAAERGICLEVEIGPGARGAAAMDADAVVPILDNLLSNAFEAIDGSGSGGAVTMTLERRNASEVALAVADTGPGVTPAAADRLFEPFFTTREGGTGLGLFLSAEMARRLGGEIRHVAHSSLGARFEFTVRR